MGARSKLNKIHIVGSLGAAGLLGLAAGSWAVFAVASAALIGIAVCTGGIREGGRRR